MSSSPDNREAVPLFIITLLVWLSIIVAVIKWWPLALVIAGLAFLRPRKLPHLLAIRVLWPSFDVVEHRVSHEYSFAIGVSGIEVHPICMLRHMLMDHHQPEPEVELAEADEPEMEEPTQEELDQAARYFEGMMRGMSDNVPPGSYMSLHDLRQRQQLDRRDQDPGDDQQEG